MKDIHKSVERERSIPVGGIAASADRTSSTETAEAVVELLADRDETLDWYPQR